jgi:hypothetical protein
LPAKRLAWVWIWLPDPKNPCRNTIGRGAAAVAAVRDVAADAGPGRAASALARMAAIIRNAAGNVRGKRLLVICTTMSPPIPPRPGQGFPRWRKAPEELPNAVLASVT